MKKFLSISLTILLSIVITYAGSGINAYSFCCEDCYTFGVEAIADQKCCDIHEDDCTEEDSFDNAICETSHDQCSLERLNIDLQDISIENSKTQISIKELDILFTTLFNNLNKIEIDEPITRYISQTQKPPNLSNLVYFSLLETLII